MDHRETAQKLFLEGYNCAQAVFCAFSDLTGLDTETAARLSSSFGGGVGRLREICGTMSGALLALGMLEGYSDVSDPEKKAAHYRLVQEYARRFRKRNGSIICRELLKDVQVTTGGIPEPRTPEFYARRPCLRLCGEAAAILDEMLEEIEIQKQQEETS
ncbi:MAG: C_GCAxxG_C_C family protein [Lachnospiraceae bacterium]|nr:C_GCAxxG_C_C family protein [Lachnospiraceae bacterium]